MLPFIYPRMDVITPYVHLLPLSIRICWLQMTEQPRGVQQKKKKKRFLTCVIAKPRERVGFRYTVIQKLKRHEHLFLSYSEFSCALLRAASFLVGISLEEGGSVDWAVAPLGLPLNLVSNGEERKCDSWT